MDDKRVSVQRPPESVPVRRLGWLRPVVGWLTLLVVFLVALWLAAAAVLAFAEGYTQDAFFFAIVAMSGFWLMTRVRRWGRDRQSGQE